MFKTYGILGLLTGCLVAVANPALAAVQYDQSVTNEVIFGSGNANGAFTTDRANGVELGLRGKLRHNALGQPENTFNSNGDGTYTFSPGVAPTQAFPTAVWSFEWSINTNYDSTTSFNLADLTYELKMTSTTGAAIAAFDPINLSVADHSIGTNSTTNGGGVEAADSAGYAALIASNNLAQNSWKPHWVATGFDPTLEGVYTFTLTAFLDEVEQASTTIEVLTPEPASAALMAAAGVMALLGRTRRLR